MGRVLRVEKACGYCGSAMVLKPAIAKQQIYCSVSCANRGKGGGRIRSVFCRGCQQEVPRVVKRSRDAGLYCSRACYSRNKTKVATELSALRAIASNWRHKVSALVAGEVAALRRIGKRPVVKRLTWAECSRGCGSITFGYMEYSRTCRACSAEAMRAVRRAGRKTEAGKRRRRIEKAMRRAKGLGLHAEKIDPFEVFAKDGWKCYLCHRDTPRDLVGGQSPNAPSVDHVVPLSKGGQHVWNNVRCACRSCNASKADTMDTGAYAIIFS